jgi:sorbitol-specific phosphotransferase system component IIC
MWDAAGPGSVRPASAYLGVAAGVGEIGKASGALAVLAINVALMVVGGTLTLVVQRAMERRAERRRGEEAG